MLNDMSDHAKTALGALGKGANIQAIDQLNKCLIEVNMNAGKTMAGMKGLMTSVKSVTTSYNEATGKILLTVKGMNTAGHEVTQVLKDIGGGLYEIQKTTEKVGVLDESKSKVKEAGEAYGRLLKAQSEYVSALKAGNTTRQAHWQGEITNNARILESIRASVSEMNISIEAKRKIWQITDDAT